MDKRLVLLKFFKVSDKILKYQEENGPNEDEFSTIVSKISVSGRNILCFLLNGKSTNQRTIAKQMNISSQAVSEVVKKLEVLNLIEKKYGLQNNENLILLTESGELIAKKLDFTIKDHANNVFSKLNDEETEQLFNLLDKIL
ncbi:MAG: MarR family winged helix-turn-helix transcriptional regulator [Clostridia bacterium]